MRPTQLSPALLTAYRAARYEVTFRGTTLRLTVGERVPARLRIWLGHAKGAGFVTPAAPFGRPCRPGAERAVFRRFLQRLRRAGARHLIGEGGSGTGVCWPAEQSVLVRLPHRSAAVAMGLALRQNAVLWARRSGPVALLPLR